MRRLASEGHRSSEAGRLQGLSLVAALLRALLFMAALILPWTAATEPIARKEITATDGDTIRARGRSYRLVGFDTPEMKQRAKCDAGRALSARRSVNTSTS